MICGEHPASVCTGSEAHTTWKTTLHEGEDSAMEKEVVDDDDDAMSGSTTECNIIHDPEIQLAVMAVVSQRMSHVAVCVCR